MNQNAILVGLGAVILIGAGILFFVNKPEPVTPTTQSEPQEQPQSTLAPATAATSAPQSDVDITVGVGASNNTATVISYAAAGYSPSSVTIKKGQTVRFVNNASADTWPASAAHPTHAVYPQKSGSDCLGSSFDACRGLKPGEFWEFTFTEVGSWNFHDHVHANHRGTVVVTQ